MKPYIVDSDMLDVIDQAEAGDLNSMFQLGMSLMSGLYTNKDLEKARSVFEAMLARDSELSVYQRWEVQGGLGIVTLQMHDYPAALEWFQKSLATMTTAPVDQWDYTLLRLIADVGWNGFVPNETIRSYLSD